MQATGVPQLEIDDPTPPASAAAALDYAPTDPRRQRHRRVRRLAYGFIACVLLAAGGRWGPMAFHRGVSLYWQRQCLREVGPPADVAVYETDPRVAATLVAGGAWRLVARGPITAGPAGLPAGAGWVAPGWEHFFGRVAWMNPAGGAIGDATVFCHRRVSPGGHERLVIVTLTDRPSRYGYGREMTFDVSVIAPGGWLRPPAEVGWGQFGADEAYPPAVYRAYAGQANGQDASRFSFRGQSDASSEFGWVFECQLEDDDSVRVTESKVLWPPVAGP